MKRRIAYGLIALAVLGLIRTAVFAPTDGGSTFSSERHGAKALFRLFERRGVDVARFFYPFSELKKRPEFARDTTLFIIGVDNTGGESELLDWIGAGNNAVIFDSPRKSFNRLYAKLEMDPTFDMTQSVSELAELNDSPISVTKPVAGQFVELEDVQHISRLGAMHVKLPKGAVSLVPHTDTDRTKAFYLEHEKGRIWYFSGTSPVDNRQIDRHDNLRLAYQLGTTGTKVIFDEFHHGFTAPLNEQKTHAWKTVFLLAGCLVIWLAFGALSRARRFGNVEAEDHEGISAGTDFAKALGKLYAEHQAASVLRFYAESWRRRAALALGVSERYSHAEFCRELLLRGLIGSDESEEINSRLSRLSLAADGSTAALAGDIAELEAFLARKTFARDDTSDTLKRIAGLDTPA